MKLHFSNSATRQHGSVAVELTVIVAFIIVPLIAVAYYLTNFFWQYTVAQKVLHDATLYMSVAPLSEIKSQGAAQVARYIISKETAELTSGATLDPEIYCGYKVSANSTVIAIRTCNDSSTPAVVYISAILTITDPVLFHSIPFSIIIPVSIRYVGA
ncbi:hypothetical protein [uncultured Massilia sp.]|uniref:hypothetical protein n=1 Tax=uncultured Massilia sp. TaxID=169973 RepID=UPI0025D8D162|nr:hypothetical protein [uncultured Massilia sp.]